MNAYEWQLDRAIHDAESAAEGEVTQDMIDFHILEWGVEMDGVLYMDGCSDAEFGECEICKAIDEQAGRVTDKLIEHTNRARS